MKIHKMFLVQSSTIPDGSTVRVSVDQHGACLAISDGMSTIRFEYDLGNENDRTRMEQMLAGLTKAIYFMQKEAGLPGPSLRLGLLKLGQTILNGKI